MGGDLMPGSFKGDEMACRSIQWHADSLGACAEFRRLQRQPGGRSDGC